MKLKERIDALTELGQQLLQPDEDFRNAMQLTYIQNAWFIPRNIEKAITAIRQRFLQRNDLETWAAQYHIPDNATAKRIGLVLAGNIPLVGFQDLLCVFMAGHHAVVKLSEKDKFLIPYLIGKMAKKHAEVAQYFTFTEKLEGFDAMIATGSNNSARYFEAYFSENPHIIRRNRNGIAVLHGDESFAELIALGEDVFSYFGLGCRNVSKLYLPRNYQFEPLLEALHEYKNIVTYNKYKNNFDYNFTLLILNKVVYKANGCVLLTEDISLQSRIACLHYEYYDDLEELEKGLVARTDEIQCIVSTKPVGSLSTILPGDAQNPSLHDYADGVDTMDFLLQLYSNPQPA